MHRIKLETDREQWEGNKMIYQKDMMVSEVLYSNEDVLEIFEKHGLPCSVCSGAGSESLEIAARVHGCDLEKLLADLNRLQE